MGEEMGNYPPEPSGNYQHPPPPPNDNYHYPPPQPPPAPPQSDVGVKVVVIFVVIMVVVGIVALAFIDLPIDNTISNKPPVANAGNDQTVNQGDTMNFIGTGSDGDGTIIKYEWDFDGDGVYDWANTSTGSTTYKYNSEGSYTASLRVTDNNNSVDSDTCLVKVNLDLTFDIGEDVIRGDYSVKINSVEEADYFIWSSDFGTQVQTPDTGAVYIIINVNITNLGEDAKYIYAGEFWILDSDDLKYDYSMDTIYHDDSLDATTLYQNQKTTGVIVFEIPNDLNQFKIQFNFGNIYEPIIGEWNITL
ncbi:MAG: DUF4352 domain-containing protein [Candidatus Thermoplasmatota archaeon]|nr:DUF4352 domain-containing protein [Candidatus Thermoplasmatota archaeon]MBU4072139.1 DUF4352 domain-containing protein [Candidatus Thermoplasmatota archaeon]MBU4143472.1 DUF4352 domain-containing protein [Candidatus Thermoplasmatota archaeon]MBU4591437.1 DUF4352 domain-containing protein [Candidatus Thermoplasmatota archaeon]